MQKQLLLGWQFLVLCCDGPWGNGFRLQEGRSGLELDREAFRDPFQLRPFCDSAVVFLLYPTRCPSSPPSQPAVPSRGSSPMLAALLHPFPPLSGHPTAPQWGYPPPPPNRGVSCLLTQSSPPSPPTSPPPALILTKCPFTLPSTSSPRALPSGPKPLTTTTPPPPGPNPQQPCLYRGSPLPLCAPFSDSVTPPDLLPRWSACACPAERETSRCPRW